MRDHFVLLAIVFASGANAEQELGKCIYKGWKYTAELSACYKVEYYPEIERVTYELAEKQCLFYGAHLTSMESTLEIDTLRSLTSNVESALVALKRIGRIQYQDMRYSSNDDSIIFVERLSNEYPWKQINLEEDVNKNCSMIFFDPNKRLTAELRKTKCGETRGFICKLPIEIEEIPTVLAPFPDIYARMNKAVFFGLIFLFPILFVALIFLVAFFIRSIWRLHKMNPKNNSKPLPPSKDRSPRKDDSIYTFLTPLDKNPNDFGVAEDAKTKPISKKERSTVNTSQLLNTIES